MVIRVRKTIDKLQEEEWRHIRAGKDTPKKRRQGRHIKDCQTWGREIISLHMNSMQMWASGSSQWTKGCSPIPVISSSPGTAHIIQKNCAVTEITSGPWRGTKALSANSIKATNNDMLEWWQAETIFIFISILHTRKTREKERTGCTAQLLKLQSRHEQKMLKSLFKFYWEGVIAFKTC